MKARAQEGKTQEARTQDGNATGGTVLVEILVEELMKNKPCEKTVQDLMKKTGIPYTADPIQQLNSVLLFMNQPKTLEELKQKDAVL